MGPRGEGVGARVGWGVVDKGEGVVVAPVGIEEEEEEEEEEREEEEEKKRRQTKRICK